MHFLRFTQTGKGLVTSTAPLNQTTQTKNIGGVEVPVRVQTGDVKFGFTAVSAELSAQMSLQVGDVLPLVLTDKPVVNTQTGEVIPNLYWAE